MAQDLWRPSGQKAKENPLKRRSDMAQDLWRPSGQKAKENPLDDLMAQIELLVREGQMADLRGLVRDLQELTQAVRELITQMAAKKAYGYGMKGGIEEALASMRGKVEAKRPPQGREVLRSIARRILET